jgi:hypothetical protein
MLYAENNNKNSENETLNYFWQIIDPFLLPHFMIEQPKVLCFAFHFDDIYFINIFSIVILDM